MTFEGARIAGSAATGDAARDWQTLRDSGDIQFAPLPPLKPPETPDWLQSLSKFFDDVFGPLGKAWGLDAPAIEKILIALLVVLALIIVWRLVQPILEARRLRRPAEQADCTPDREAVVALLVDADRLAAEGRYDEATHLLLQRSVGHIAETRPEWLLPASTAREIASLPMLPARAREAFAVIAARVERSLFALRKLNGEDWRAARSAYADFALAELGG